jgi:hypothetical protein
MGQSSILVHAAMPQTAKNEGGAQESTIGETRVHPRRRDACRVCAVSGRPGLVLQPLRDFFSVRL